MAKECETWGQLVEATEKRCKEILHTDVAEEARKIIQRHIRSDIYDAYTPKKNGWIDLKTGRRATYERRYSLLGDKSTDWILGSSFWSNAAVGILGISITKTATPSPPIVKGSIFRSRQPGAFLALLESGNMGLWRSGFPRPAITNAQKEIDKSPTIKEIIKTGLNK